MSVAQAEFVAYKGEIADRLKRLEDTLSQTMDDMKKAAPWSVTIETAVAAAEAKAEAANKQVLSLFDATKAEVEDLRRRPSEVEKKSGSQKSKWEMSRPKDMELLSFGAKEEQCPRFREQLKDYAEACHPGIKSQLELALKQKVAITHGVLQDNPLGCAEEF